MRDPYKPRRDLPGLGPIVIGALLLLMAALIGVYLLKPEASTSEQREAAAFQQEMDRSQAAASTRQRRTDADRKAAFD